MNRNILLALAVLIAMQGCTAVQSARYAVNRYCALPEDSREVVRLTAAKALSPNRISITCEDA